MTTKATTFRLDHALKTRLDLLGEILGQPINRLVNEAVRDYVERRIQEVEVDLEATLANLRAYRARDPDFRQSIEDFAAAEAAVLPRDDPAEGEIVENLSNSADAPSDTETQVLKLLNG